MHLTRIPPLCNRKLRLASTLSNLKIGVKGMVFFGTPNQRQAFNNIQSSMYDRKKAIVEIVLAGSRRMLLEVDISVWNSPKSELLPPDEAKWSPTSFLRSQFYENIAGPLDRIVHLSQPGPEGSIQTENTNPTRPPMSADVRKQFA